MLNIVNISLTIAKKDKSLFLTVVKQPLLHNRKLLTKILIREKGHSMSDPSIQYYLFQT